MRGLRAGDAVVVKSLAEIASTLDSDGMLDHLPFMPEMIPFAGRRFTVRSRLEKTCVEERRQRRMEGTVTLEGVYCDGAGHDGCQRSCPLLWKEAWLDLDDGFGGMAEAPDDQGVPVPTKTRREGGAYLCQSTELSRATHSMRTVGFDRCTLEWRSGNVGFADALRYLWIPLVVQVKGRALGQAAVRPIGQPGKTPREALGLQPGDTVEVKSPEEIAATVDDDGRNRGLQFTATMLPFCGNRYRVRSRVDRMILEATGEMVPLENTVILDGVVCDGHTFLGGCSRLVFHLWREAWLRRVPSADGARRSEEESAARRVTPPG